MDIYGAVLVQSNLSRYNRIDTDSIASYLGSTFPTFQPLFSLRSPAPPCWCFGTHAPRSRGLHCSLFLSLRSAWLGSQEKEVLSNLNRFMVGKVSDTELAQSFDDMYVVRVSSSERCCVLQLPAAAAAAAAIGTTCSLVRTFGAACLYIDLNRSFVLSYLGQGSGDEEPAPLVGWLPVAWFLREFGINLGRSGPLPHA